MSDFDNGFAGGFLSVAQYESLGDLYSGVLQKPETHTDFSKPSEEAGGIPDYAKEPYFTVEDPVTSFKDDNFAGGGQEKPGVSGFSLSDDQIYDEYLSPEILLNKVASNQPAPSGLSDNEYGKSHLSKGNAAFYFLSSDTHNPFQKDLVHRGISVGSSVAAAAEEVSLLDVQQIRKDFPILNEKVNGKSLIWFDNAATTQKPQRVIDRISYFYAHENSNVHRGAHELAARSTDAYENARETVRQFLNASSSNEIVFVRGTTEAINLVAKTWGDQYLKSGDEIVLSELEHHANIVPWQQLAKAKGLVLRVIPVDDRGQLLLDDYSKLLSSGKVKLVAFTQVSNALGTVTPAKKIIEFAHRAGARVLLDGAQSVSHLQVDLQRLNPDWFVFSGHKIFGPTGIGVLYGKEELLNQTQPWQSGGNMIRKVTFEETIYNPAPGRFEAGTGNIADAVGLGAALQYVQNIGLGRIEAYENQLLAHATRYLKEIPGLQLIGTAEHKASVLSFTLKGYTNDEVGKALNREGIAVRTGHHCAQPILRRFGLESTVRPSLAFYNTTQEIDALVAALYKLRCHKTLL